jgi:hypothetical protein
MMSRLRHLRSITLDPPLRDEFPAPVPHGTNPISARPTRVATGERPLDYRGEIAHAADKCLVLGRTTHLLTVYHGPVEQGRQLGRRGDR